MYSNDDVRDEMTAGRENGHASLAKLEMNSIVEQGRCRVAHERGQEDEGNDDKSQMVVIL